MLVGDDCGGALLLIQLLVRERNRVRVQLSQAEHANSSSKAPKNLKHLQEIGRRNRLVVREMLKQASNKQNGAISKAQLGQYFMRRTKAEKVSLLCRVFPLCVSLMPIPV